MRLELYKKELLSLGFIALSIGAVWTAATAILCPPPGPRTVAVRSLMASDRAIDLYQVDSDGRAPLAASWQTATAPYRNDKQLVPTGFVTRLEGAVLDAVEFPDRQVLLFETHAAGPNAHSNFTNVGWRKDRETVVSFVTGSKRWYRYYDPNAPAEGSGLAPKATP